MPQTKPNNKPKISINDILNEPNKNIKITSPRSLLSLQIAGLTIEDLIFISFNTFVNNYPETKKFPKQMQEKLYTFYEKHRIEKINEVKKIYDDIKEKELKRTCYSEGYNSSKVMTNRSQSQSSMINNDMKRLNQMKAKNEQEILNMIQNEINKELILKRAEEKIMIQREIQKRHQEEMRIKKEEEQAKKEKIEYEKRLKEIEEEKRIEMLEKERKEKEQERYRKEKEEEERRMKELKIKQEEEERKKRETQEAIEQRREEERILIEKRQKELELKTKERQEYLELQRFFKIKENERKNMLKQKKMAKSRKNLESKLTQIRMEYIRKEEEAKIKKEHYDKIKQERIQKQKEDALKKAEMIKQIQIRNKSLEKEKIEKFNEKQRQIELKRAQLAEELEKEKEEKNKKNKIKKEKCKQSLENNEKRIQQQQEIVLKKIEAKDETLKKVLQERDNLMLQKKEAQLIKNFLKDENLRRINLKESFLKETTLSQLIERDKKIEEIKQQKMQLFIDKKKLQKEIAEKKNEYSTVIQSILQKQSLDQDSIKPLKELFPNNPRFEYLISQLKQERPQFFLTSTVKHRNINKSNSFLMKKTISSNSESGIHRNKSSTELHITHKSTNASTIEEKVNDYKKLLNKELVNLIEKEHTKEEERQRFFSSITDPKEKKYYTKLYEKQRAEANRQIVELNEVNERKAIMYSIKLKRDTNH